MRLVKRSDEIGEINIKRPVSLWSKASRYYTIGVKTEFKLDITTAFLLALLLHATLFLSNFYESDLKHASPLGMESAVTVQLVAKASDSNIGQPELVKSEEKPKEELSEKPVEIPLEKIAQKVIKKSSKPKKIQDIASAPSVSNADSSPAASIKGSLDQDNGELQNSGSIVSARPNYLKNPPPIYPEESRRRGEAGKVVLLVSIDESGGVSELKIDSSSGFERLDQSAVRAVKSWRFQAATKGGIAVSDRVKVPVVFSLRDR
jgi:protein TonB